MEVNYIHHVGDDLSSVNAARVSFGKKSDWVYCSGESEEGQSFCAEHCESDPHVRCPDLKDKDKRLINYLATHGHHSPFNHSFITIHVKAPIFVARQLQKHKFMPWNEISRRYVDTEPEFFWPEEWRGRSEDKKQGSSEEKVEDPTLYVDYEEGFDEHWRPEDCVNRVADMYDAMLDDNVAPEQARMILPLNTYTEWYWSGTLGAWADMYNLRSKPDAQQETRTIALECGEIIKPLFPVSWSALTKEVAVPGTCWGSCVHCGKDLS